MSLILKLLILTAFQHALRSIVDGKVLFFLNFLSSFFLYHDHDHCTDKSIYVTLSQFYISEFMIVYYLQQSDDSARVHLLQVTVKLPEVTTLCTR